MLRTSIHNRARGLFILCTIWAAALLALASPGAAEEQLSIPYTVSKPAGDGPFPAVVILHDCSGLGPRSSGAPSRWSNELNQRGYVTIRPDSFSTRGHPAGVCRDASPPRIFPAQRVDDAYAALRYMQSLPFVDARRVAVMGGSHGGSTTLATIVDTPRNTARGKARFAAAVALYPSCGFNLGGWSVERHWENNSLKLKYSGAFKPLAPLLILSGELDDWTPAEPCRRLSDIAQKAGYPVSIKIYPGAHHSFDSVAPVRYVAERVNSNSPSGHGATTGGNASAWADAILQVEQFLKQHLGK